MKSRKLRNKRQKAQSKVVRSLLFLIIFLCPVINKAQKADVVIQTGHSTYITGLAMTSDVSRIISSDLSGAIKVFDVHANKEIFQFKSSLGLCNTLELNNDENIVAYDDGYKIKRINIYTGKSLGLLQTGGLNGIINSISFSPNTNHIAVATTKTIQVFEGSIQKPKIKVKSEDEFVLVKWLTDSTIIACHKSGNNEILSTINGNKISSINTTTQVITADNHFGGITLICDNGETFSLEIADTTLIRYSDIKRKLYSARMMTKSNYMLVGKKGKLEVIDLSSNELVDWFYFNERDSITQITSDLKRQYICVGTDFGDVFIWDTKDRRIVSGHEIGIYKQLLTLSVNSRGDQFLIGGMVHGGKLINLDGRVSVQNVANDYRLLSSAFHPTNQSEFTYGGYFGATFFYDLNNYGPHDRMLTDLKEGNAVTSNFISDDGKKMISVSDHIQIYDYEKDTFDTYNRPFINNGVFEEFADFHSGNNQLIFGNVDGGATLFDTKKGRIIHNKIPDMEKPSYASFNDEGKFLYAIVNNRVTKWTTKDWKLQKQIAKIQPPMICRYLNKSKQLVVGYANGDIEFFDENLFSTGAIHCHKSRVIDIEEMPNSDRFATIDFNGEIKVWSQSGKEWLYGIITGRWGNDMIVFTPDNYYMATGKGLNFIAFKNDQEIFQPEQFDLIYNRPDIVLSRVGFASQDMITAFNHAWKRRMNKMGVTASASDAKWHAPTIQFVEKDNIPVKSTSMNMEFDVEFSDTLFKLNRLDVLLNGVPVFGIKGIDISDVQSHRHKWNMDLTDGVNKIQVSVTNENGIESVKETVFIYYEPEKIERSLYVLNIGANEYQQSDYNLKYAGKDAEDLNNLFTSDTNFVNVYSKTIIGQEFTKDKIPEIKRFFMNAKRNDIVICTIAGHGVLDDNLDYYFSTYDMDFSNPAEKGVGFKEFESVVDGLEAVRKLIIIDACHSGEIDKEDIKIEQNASVTNGKVVFRAVGEKVTQHKAIGLKSVGDLTRELFSDLRTGTGSIIISSAGGAEYAMEGDEWQNGVFTYAMLEGIKGGLADYSKNGRISVEEILDYTSNRVKELTNGKQKPDYRSINREFNFNIW